MDKIHACVEFVVLLPVLLQYDPESMNDLAMKLSKLTSNVVIVHGETDQQIELQAVLNQTQISGKVWITTALWNFASHFAKTPWNLTRFHGALSFAVHKREIPGFQDFLKTINPNEYTNDFYLKHFWSQVFKCSWPDYILNEGWTRCTGREKLDELNINLFDMNTSIHSYSIFNAIYAVAHILQEMYYLKSAKKKGARVELHDIHAWQVNVSTRKKNVT